MAIPAAQIREMVAGILEVPAEAVVDSLGVGDIPQWDSLAQMAIMTTLEEEYGLSVPEERMMELATIGQIIAFANGEGEPCAPPPPPAAPSPSLPPAAANPAAAPAVPPYNRQPVELTILQRADECPAKAAIVFEHQAVTYRQLVLGMRSAATCLQQRGVKPGDVVALYAEKTKEFFYCYFGAHLLGAAVLNLDASIKEERRSYVFEQTRPALCLGAGLKADARFDEIGLEQFAPDAELPAPSMDAVADIMFTTGTTGEPKGVPLTHANLAAAAWQINSFIGTCADDVEVLALPICHSFGMGRSRCVLAAGGTLVPVPGFSNPKRLFAAMDQYRATGLAFVPAAWAYLQKMSGDALAAHAAGLRYIEIGSAAMDAATRRHLMELFPHARICMHYGLTEASRSAFIEFHSQSSHLDSAGLPAPHVQISILSPEGSPVHPGEEGEICIKGDHVVAAYLNQPAAACRHGEFFRTGDWGTIDADGYLHVLSRTKDIINTGGKKVSPDEVEGILCAVPGVAEAACVPAPDPKGVLGEVVRAVLVSDGTPHPTDATLRAAVAAQAEAYKVPAVIEWRDSLPRTESGKLRRRLV